MKFQISIKGIAFVKFHSNENKSILYRTVWGFGLTPDVHALQNHCLNGEFARVHCPFQETLKRWGLFYKQVQEIHRHHYEENITQEEKESFKEPKFGHLKEKIHNLSRLPSQSKLPEVSERFEKIDNLIPDGFTAADIFGTSVMDAWNKYYSDKQAASKENL